MLGRGKRGKEKDDARGSDYRNFVREKGRVTKRSESGRKYEMNGDALNKKKKIKNEAYTKIKPPQTGRRRRGVLHKWMKIMEVGGKTINKRGILHNRTPYQFCNQWKILSHSL